jgi:SAM-dependent methyltransferase
MTQGIWSDLHNTYKNQDWIDKPSIFATQAVEFFPSHGKLLELGAGLGQDSRFFAEFGYDVVATDIEPTVLEIDKRKLSPDIKGRVEFKQMDLRHHFEFDDEEFDVVYAHLSLHYFSEKMTKQIFSEINRVLKKGGVLAFLVNSTTDPEYGTGNQIEPDFFQIEQATKRYFSVISTEQFTEGYEVKLLDNRGETYKDAIKGVHNLVRFIGEKPKF